MHFLQFPALLDLPVSPSIYRTPIPLLPAPPSTTHNKIKTTEKGDEESWEGREEGVMQMYR